MTLSNSNLSQSCVRPVARSSQLPLRIATAILMCAAAGMLLIYASAWGGVPSGELDSLTYLF
jgi:hypothetical protein